MIGVEGAEAEAWCIVRPMATGGDESRKVEERCVLVPASTSSGPSVPTESR
jgi:hypothetical protein